MHGVAPHMCTQVVRSLLGQGAGGRSPGYLPLVAQLRRQRRPQRRCSGGARDGRSVRKRVAAPSRAAIALPPVENFWRSNAALSARSVCGPAGHIDFIKVTLTRLAMGRRRTAASAESSEKFPQTKTQTKRKF